MISGERGTSFVYQDANWNVIGLTAPAGHLVEEYHYTPYGRMVATTHSAFGDATGDGDVDAADNTAFTAAQTTYNRNFDADFNGIINSFDQAAFTANYNASAPSVVVPNRFLSPNDNPYTFTGRRLDAATRLMHYRYRAYHPQLRRFAQRDPLGYAYGPDLHGFPGASPVGLSDPFGLGPACEVYEDWKEEFAALPDAQAQLEVLIQERDKYQEELDFFMKNSTLVNDLKAAVAGILGGTLGGKKGAPTVGGGKGKLVIAAIIAVAGIAANHAVNKYRDYIINQYDGDKYLDGEDVLALLKGAIRADLARAQAKVNAQQRIVDRLLDLDPFSGNGGGMLKVARDACEDELEEEWDYIVKQVGDVSTKSGKVIPPFTPNGSPPGNHNDLVAKPGAVYPPLLHSGVDYYYVKVLPNGDWLVEYKPPGYKRCLRP